MLNIRPATREDVPQLLAFIRELATYEKKLHKCLTTEDDLLRDGFGQDAKFRSLIAEWDGEAAGYAVFFYFYSTFQGRPALFLEDLYVPDKFRGKGIGKALLAAVAKLALEEKRLGMRWDVLYWDTPAIAFYKPLGSAFLDERRAVAFDEEGMRRVAGE